MGVGLNRAGKLAKGGPTIRSRGQASGNEVGAELLTHADLTTDLDCFMLALHRPGGAGVVRPSC
ncbi:MAG: hypothetical protein ACRD0K_26920 [Egibacteraceae bacterium]